MKLAITADEIKATIGPERVANLKKLAEYLERGELQAGFYMREFFDNKTSSYYAATCGAAGSAAGHGPYAGIEKRETEDWHEYVERVFTPISSPLFHWLFSSGWFYADNSAAGAAARIRLALAYGVPTDCTPG